MIYTILTRPCSRLSQHFHMTASVGCSLVSSWQTEQPVKNKLSRDTLGVTGQAPFGSIPILLLPLFSQQNPNNVCVGTVPIRPDPSLANEMEPEVSWMELLRERWLEEKSWTWLTGTLCPSAAWSTGSVDSSRQLALIRTFTCMLRRTE